MTTLITGLGIDSSKKGKNPCVFLCSWVKEKEEIIKTKYENRGKKFGFQFIVWFAFVDL